MGPSGTSTDRMRSLQYVRRRNLVAAMLAAANLCAWVADAQVPAATLDDNTTYLRIPPGEKDLKKAAKIALPDVAVGDRAFVRGHMAEDQKSIAAVAVIIMTKSDLAQKHERDREEWKRRGLAGPITAINMAAKEVTISTRAREGPKLVV